MTSLVRMKLPVGEGRPRRYREIRVSELPVSTPEALHLAAAVDAGMVLTLSDAGHIALFLRDEWRKLKPTRGRS